MPEGEIARSNVGEVLSAMKRGEGPAWSTDYRCMLPDGSSLRIEVDSSARLIRAVVLDPHGAVVDVTEATSEPPVGRSVILPIHRLRSMVDEQLAARASG